VDNNSALAVMRPDGSGLRVVSAAGLSYSGPIDWSPDGRWLVAHASNGSMLHLVEVESSMTLPLPYTAGLSNPAWRP
jgi:Tol biopolymer transport system component